jgi:RimJ/RimL family protein N-acetyltransferase
MNVCLVTMSQELARRYFSGFIIDPALFMDGQEFRPYVYSEDKADEVVSRYEKLGRIYMAVMLDGDPIGEIVFKDIDSARKTCTLGISLQSDQYKNKGYGTQEEILALKYAFNAMGMQTVFADSILKNTRSQHVLKKVGFAETHRDDSFVYYRCDRDTWKHPMTEQAILLQ